MLENCSGCKYSVCDKWKNKKDNKFEGLSLEDYANLSQNACLSFALSEQAQDVKMLKKEKGWIPMAFINSDPYSGWSTSPASQKMAILKLKNGDMAKDLAGFSVVNGWAKTPAAQNTKVLKLSNGDVARILALNADKNGWGDTPVGKMYLEHQKKADALFFGR